MELKFKLYSRPSQQLKELRLISEKNNIGIYNIICKWPGAPELDYYMRILYNEDNSIHAIDFDGGPMISSGYKLDKNNTITRIFEDKNTHEFLVEVQKSQSKMKKEKYYYGEDLRRGYGGIVLVDSRKNVIQVNDVLEWVPVPRVTICGIYDNEAQTMSYGVAKCSSTDEFIKELGRRISYARASKRPYRVVKINPEDKISKLFIDNAKQIEKEVLSGKGFIK